MKLRLTVLKGSLSGQTFDLEQGHLLIGRSQNCSVRFDPIGENIVSSQHAFVYTTDEGFFVRDNNSTNGTYLNGQPVSNARLANGDVITFGKEGIDARIAIADVRDSATTADIVGAPAPTAPSGEQMPSFETIEKIGSGTGNLGQSITGFGLSAPAVHLPPPQTVTHVAVVIMTLLIVLAALPVFLIIVAGLGPIATLIATVAAFLPVIIYLLPLMWLDRYDPEPFWLVLLCFAWGGIVAVLASAIVNDVFTLVATASTGNLIIGEIAGAVISAPFIEEVMKGAGVLAMLLFFRRHFDDVLDGIVFGGVIALGFAAVENVLYYGRFFLAEGLGGLAIIFVLRGILSPFAHVTFTAMTGIGCGIARESHSWFVRVVTPLFGLAAAMFLHAVWNGMSMLWLIIIRETGSEPYCEAVGLGAENLPICGFLIGYTVLEIPVFLFFIAVSLFVMRRQSRTLREMLAIDVARGVVAQEHLDIATSMFRSLFWPIGGMTSGKFFNRRRYLRAIGSLGLSYWHIQRATKAEGHTASFQTNPYLRAEVERLGKLV